jgi:hypothetical protein
MIPETQPLWSTPRTRTQTRARPGPDLVAVPAAISHNEAMSRLLRVGLIGAGTLATIASAVVGLRMLAVSLEVDELDSTGNVRGAQRLALTGEGPLRGLLRGQEAELRYRSRGCFHHLDASFTFARGSDGRLSVTKVAKGGWELERVVTRVLTEDDVTALDRQLLYAQHAPRGGCTTLEELDLVIREGSVERRSHFVDETCEGPELPRGAVTLADLSRDWPAER